MSNIRQREGRRTSEAEVSFKGWRVSGGTGGRVRKVVDPGMVSRIMASQVVYVLTPPNL